MLRIQNRFLAVFSGRHVTIKRASHTQCKGGGATACGVKRALTKVPNWEGGFSNPPLAKDVA